MSAILTVRGVHVFLSVPGSTPAAGLTSALELTRDALAVFPATPAPAALAPAVVGLAWRAHGPLLRLLPSAAPQARTSHLVAVDLSGTPVVQITTVVFDELDETFGQLFEGSFVAADVLRNINTLVRAITVGA